MQSGNPDIREEVERSRGLLKKIQLHIPLFSGYRKLEDIRVADELLRKQVSGVLQQVMDSLQAEREDLVRREDFAKLTLIGSQLSKVQEFQGELLHAQQGSSGISPAVRIDGSTLNRLYDYDLKFLEISASILDLCKFSDSDDIAVPLQKISEAVSNAKEAWQSRMQAVENILLSQGGK